MAIRFHVLGEQLSFHEDLKKYYALSCDLQEKHDEIAKSVQADLQARKEPAEIYLSVEKAVKDVIGGLLNTLSRYGVFDRTVGDYLNGSEGYLLLLRATNSYYDYANSTKEKHTSTAEIKKQAASVEAANSVRGLDFGILSGSMIAHAVYSSMNQAEVQKQSAEAFSKLANVCSAINAVRDGNISKDMDTYEREVYSPALFSALRLLFRDLLSTYAADLQKCGQIDLACLDRVDYDRAGEIIANISGAENKKGVFLKALEICPYNAEVYQKGYTEYLLPEHLSITQECGDLISYFGLQKPLHNLLVSPDSLLESANQKLKSGNYAGAEEIYKNMTDIYADSCRGWLGLLLCATKKFTDLSVSGDVWEPLYNETKRRIPDLALQERLKEAVYTYRGRRSDYKKLCEEKDRLLRAKETAAQFSRESRKTMFLFAALTGVFGIFAAIFLILFFVCAFGGGNAGSAIGGFAFTTLLTLFCFWLYNSRKKEIESLAVEDSQISETKRKISRIKNEISDDAEYEKLLRFSAESGGKTS